MSIEENIGQRLSMYKIPDRDYPRQEKRHRNVYSERTIYTLYAVRDPLLRQAGFFRHRMALASQIAANTGAGRYGTDAC